MTPEILDRLITSPQTLGISCTAAAVSQPDWVRNHTARKVIIHRPPFEINESLASIGLPPIEGKRWLSALADIDGLHCNYRDLFGAKTAERIWDYLFHTGFDAKRHALLAGFNIQPDFDMLQWRPMIGRRLMGNLMGEK